MKCIIVYSIILMNRMVSAWNGGSSTTAITFTNSPRLALVTGATDGIGLTTAKNLAKKGYQVIVHGRDATRIQTACDQVNQFASQSSSNSNSNSNSSWKAIPALADLSSLAGCHELVSMLTQQLLQSSPSSSSSSYPTLSIIVHNAGVFSEKLTHVGEQHLEETFAVNVLAPFVLTSLLLPTLMNQPKNEHKHETEEELRIVVASSISQSSSISNWDDVAYYKTQPFSSHTTYSDSKLLVSMMTYELSHRLATKTTTQFRRPRSITMNCLDPGTVNTKMLIAGWGYCGMNVDQALDETWCCTSKQLRGVSGKYFVGRTERKSSRFAYDPTERQRLWELLCLLAPEAACQWD